MSDWTLRPLLLADMSAAAAIHRAAFDARLPWLAGLHTPEEDRVFWSTHLFPTKDTWGAQTDGELVGVIAFGGGWVDQLYVLPEVQGRGIGSALLNRAKSQQTVLELWTFQKNIPARRFYEARGFVAVEKTDGQGNEEKEPDIRYCWCR